MNIQKKKAVILGALFLIALFSDIISISISNWLGIMILDLISGVALIGIGITIFKIFKPYNKNLSLGYSGIRIIEGLFFIFMAISLLYQMTTSGISVSTVLIDTIYVYIFGSGAFIFYYLLYKTKFVPRFISIWGFIAIIMLLIANSLGMLGNDSAMTIFLASPIALNELFLAIWLIFKGFNIK